MMITEEDRKACGVHLGEDGRSVVILDQTQLPNRQVYLTLRTVDEIYDAIKRLSVRGAPAIGICAGYGMYVLALAKTGLDRASFVRGLRADGEKLISSRPTAVNLSWAIKRMLSVMEASGGGSPAEIAAEMGKEAIAIHDEDIAMCTRISEFGLSLLKDGDGVITHCNQY